jgi:hypothetical protein
MHSPLLSAQYFHSIAQSEALLEGTVKLVCEINGIHRATDTGERAV